MQDTDGKEKAAVVVLANRLLEAISAPYKINDHNIVIGASIGIALAPQHAGQADHLLKFADLAMYYVKSQGRNGYCFFQAEFDAEARQRYALESDLREALSRNQFELYYQPVVSVATGSIVGVEALLRWRHPERGLLSPDKFMSQAEETGLIMPVGEWVLRTSCAVATTWPDHIKLAVNVSSAQFRKGRLVDTVVDVLSKSGLPTHRLQLEITEAALLQDKAGALSTMHQLRQIGVGLVLDNFGAEVSSLRRAHEFAFDKIKIDRSIVAELPGNIGSAATVLAVCGLAKGLNIATLAEGVETQEQYALIELAGCDEAQGFLMEKPLPASSLNFGKVVQKDDARQVA
jgi:predicted signal transduction protein with EAL and GGDEF domain